MSSLLPRRVRQLLWTPVHLSLFTVHAVGVAAQESSSEPISDNSFLIEEAYNQEPGVVQHIGNFARSDGGEAWAFSFTQEWPLGGMRHQLSYMVPVVNTDGTGTGLGDVGVNYRYQLRGVEGGPLAVAPRLTAVLPTGSEDRGRGSGSVGLQTNLPVSYTIGSALATHWNAGFILSSESAPIWNLGASAIWLLRPTFNVLVEALWLARSGEERVFLNPGIRWAHDFDSGLQIVPGLAYTIGLGPSSGDDGLFLYLSFEHPFKR
jgi:Putative MetA-pathway of phenol degradation